MEKKNHIDWLTIVLSDSNGGGTEYNQRNLISHLADNGKKCTVVILQKKNYGSWEFLEGNCTIVYFPFKSPFLGYLYLLPYLINFSRKTDVSYVFSSQTLINGLLGFFKRLGFIKTSKLIVRESNSIFELLGGAKLKRYKIAYKLGYSAVDLVICQTSYMKNQLTHALPWLEKKVPVTVINNPVNHKDIKTKSKESIAGLENEKYFIAAGRLVDAKGFDILIRAFSKIHTKLNGCSLFILGEGPNRDELIQQINTLGLEDKIILKGLVPNVYPYFKNAELCVMSSRIEGFPNVLLQMMSQNEKVVSTLSAGDIDSIPGIYTLPINDDEELANAMLKCYNSNCAENRKLFNAYLEERSLEAFVSKIKTQTRDTSTL